MGNTSPLRKAIRAHDTEGASRILQVAGPGAADLINEDHTFDCLLDCCASNYQHPLHTALGYPHHRRDLIDLLVQHGADVNATGKLGETCVHRAAWLDALSLVKLFVDNGGDLYARDDNGQCPIHYAARAKTHGKFQTIEVLEYFVEVRGTSEDLKLSDDRGDTPLHVAAFVDNVQAVEYILEKGGDKRAKNNFGAVPLDKTKKGSKCRTLLESHD